jgi:hypothetical protein
VGGYEEISSGPAPRGDAASDQAQRRLRRLPRIPRPARPRWWPPGWAHGWARPHSRLVTAGVAVALALAAGVSWTWQRTHPPARQTQLLVQVDPSEYLLPGHFDVNGQAAVLLLLRVTVGDRLDGTVRMLGLSGGGIASADQHQVAAPGQARFAVRATLSCDQWADGSGVQARFAVAIGGRSQVVAVPLDAGQASPLHAEITGPCIRFAAQHPLRLAGFTVVLDPSRPLARTTWTLLNRSTSSVVLPGSSDVALIGAAPPLQVLADADPTTVQPGGTAFVVRTFAVTSCLDPAALDVTGVDVRMTGLGAASVQLPGGVATVDLPAAFAGSVLAVARSACDGAPVIAGARATLRLLLPPAGTVSPDLGGSPGLAVLRVTGQVTPPAPVLSFVQPGSTGPWTATVAEPAWYVGPQTGRPFASLSQALPHPGELSLAGAWALTSCDQALHATIQSATVTVLLSGLRVYPYLLPAVAGGETTCSPGGIRS